MQVNPKMTTKVQGQGDQCHLLPNISTMNRLSIEFIIRMKEERDSSLYSQYIEKVIQHVGAVDTSVRDVDVQDVAQTIKTKVVDLSQG